MKMNGNGDTRRHGSRVETALVDNQADVGKDAFPSNVFQDLENATSNNGTPNNNASAALPAVAGFPSTAAKFDQNQVSPPKLSRVVTAPGAVSVPASALETTKKGLARRTRSNPSSRGQSRTRSKSPQNLKDDSGTQPGAVSTISAPSTNRGLSKGKQKPPPSNTPDDVSASPSNPSSRRGQSRTRSKSPQNLKDDSGTQPGAVPTISAPSTNRGLSKGKQKPPPRNPPDDVSASPGAVPTISAPSTNRGLSKTKAKRDAQSSQTERMEKEAVSSKEPADGQSTISSVGLNSLAQTSTHQFHARWPPTQSTSVDNLDRSQQGNQWILEDLASSLDEVGPGSINQNMEEDMHIQPTPINAHSTDAETAAGTRENEGLVQAVPVNDERSRSFFPQAEAVDMENERDLQETDNKRKRKERQCQIIGAIIIGICAVVIILSLVYGTRNKPVTIAEEPISVAPTNSVMPSFSPSSMPTETLLSARYEIKGLSESTAEEIGKYGSPQQQAYDWTFQHPDFDDMPNWRKQQLFALGTFYFSFENWPEEYQWMDYSNTECSWTTSLDSNPGEATSSDFIPEGYSNPGISGTIPSEIGMLSLLTNLNLHSTGISGTIPSGIGQTNLTWLYLHDNSISGFLPSELGLLPFLERMDLQFNDISGTVPADLGNCTSLVWVDARNNYLTGLSPEIGLLTSMQYLLLRDNTIKGTIPSEIGLLSNLVYLSLERNSITGTFPSTFDQSSLDQMDLQGNQLSSIPSEIGLLGNQIGQLDLSNNLILTLPSELFLLTSLSVLQLHGNRIEQLPQEIDQMTILDSCDNSIDGWLSFSSNKLSSIPSEIGRLTNLRTLTMQDNQISSFPDVNWSHLTNLASIQLSHNLLHSTIPSELGLLQKLVKLDLSNNALIGSIPSELGENEATAYVWNNTLRDYVAQDARLFQTLILRNNQLSGWLPSELDLDHSYRIQFYTG
ncbi:Fibronectin leucine rich transmembrane protein [Seminavis robusta]|uniref:Fibronectin leucine rich transmembrane protein n=1 Tax=Seminavis robusta TaxID=568900 RepID=A0A9N8D8N3_9STRA|nr:Fibronectin leucine rich transmembrane protein [Seminavis robusta]|eukprot:Sro16_g012010.1 Fibronectin leucine rich transmembrane protein (958) ;mRNA; r:188610-191824